MDAKGSFVELTTLLSLWLALVHHFPREERPGSLEEDGEENTFLESELCPPPPNILGSGNSCPCTFVSFSVMLWRCQS